MARIRQAGEGKLGCILWLLAAGLAVMIALEAIPVRIRTAEMADYIDDAAKFHNDVPVDELRRRIVNKADELELPIAPEQVKIVKERGKIKFDVQYTVPLEFPGYTYEWEIHHLLTRDIFIF